MTKAKRKNKALKVKKATKVNRGEQGEQGIAGETPEITVEESTPLIYKFRFKTSDQDIVTPNLIAPLTEYHADLSATNSLLTIPIENLVLTYQNASTTSMKISIAPKDESIPVLTDMRRSSI